MFYQTAPDGLAKAAAHVARLREFHARGVLLMAGPCADPAQGALGIFTSREAAEEFASGDPFLTDGVVSNWTLQDWNDVLT
ncbi:YciI family protein [Burkholderia sp. ABCPW 14]|uniref:YciI family protein n=1 Tax=Burkholderia sp. ABCPW 14 TaxID=1637860 RepID=UPI003FA4399E